MIIVDQWNQTAHLYDIQITIINSRAILDAVTSAICKTCTGTLANSETSEDQRGVWSGSALFD